MKKFFVLWAVFLSLVQPFSGFADDVTYNKEPGKPPQVNFKDGRVAQLFIDSKPMLTLKVPFKIIDSECNDNINIQCEYRTTVGMDILSLVWTVNPDASKINTPLQQSNSSLAPTPLTYPNIYGVNDRLSLPKLAANIPNDEIHCDDYSWLPGVSKTLPDTAYLERLDGEAMAPNPESEVNENRTFGGAVGVTLKKNAQGNLSFVQVKKYSGPTFEILNAQKITIVVKDNEGGYCSIAGQTDTTAAGAAFIANFNSAPHYQPYLYGRDEYSNADRMALLLTTLKGDQDASK